MAAPKDPGLWKIPVQASARGGDEGVNRSRGAAFSFGLLKPFCFRGKRVGGSSDLLLTPKSPFPGQGRGLAACTGQGLSPEPLHHFPTEPAKPWCRGDLGKLSCRRRGCCL